MPNILRSLLTMGLTVGLSDKEAFIQKVAGVIEQYRQNPEEAEKWAAAAAEFLEQWKDDLRMQTNIHHGVKSSGLPDKEQMERLTAAIEKLTREMQKPKA